MEDMNVIGFFGIFKQSFKTIFSRKKIFTQITLAFILPLAITFVVEMEISRHFFRQIDNITIPYYLNYPRQATAAKWIYYALFTIAYFILLTVFSTLATAAGVFTVASVYTGREAVLRDVIKIVPKVWKRLYITFAFIYITELIYDVIGTVATKIPGPVFDFTGLGEIFILIILILYVFGFLYLSVVCQLASVVTVLESIHGFQALKKGKNLAKGKKTVGIGIAFVLYGVLAGLIVVCLLFVEYGHAYYRLALIWRVLIGVSCGIVLLMLFLVFMVTQTVLYMVCKSYHQEAIDKLSLSTFLGAYMGETVAYPGAGEEIQLRSTQPPTQQVCIA
ncbi:hypothetical protein R6Q57_022478 [Mikania cordata]